MLEVYYQVSLRVCRQDGLRTRLVVKFFTGEVFGGDYWFFPHLSAVLGHLNVTLADAGRFGLGIVVLSDLVDWNADWYGDSRWSWDKLLYEFIQENVNYHSSVGKLFLLERTLTGFCWLWTNLFNLYDVFCSVLRLALFMINAPSLFARLTSLNFINIEALLRYWCHYNFFVFSRA